MDHLPTGSGVEMDQFSGMIGLQMDQPNLLEATKRRSSNRSIKRRRFDDEIVESSLGNQGALTASKVARTRTHSTSSPGLGPYTRYLPSPQPTTPVTLTAASVGPVAEVVVPTTSVAVAPVAVTPAAVGIANTAEPPRPRRAGGPKPVPTGGRRNRRPGRHQHSVATKDLGRWKPTDDLALILGVQQTNDMRMVHRGVKFSCRFTVQELQQRWYALLYEPSVSRIAVAAMRNLHPEMIASVQSKALYSKPEEQLLATVKPAPNPTVQIFQDLLEKNAHIFHPARTPKALLTHWLLMKQYHLLPDQTVQSLPRGEHVLNFSDAEDLITDAELVDPRDIRCEKNLAQADRKGKKEMRKLENEIGRWQVLVDSVTGISPPDFDNQTLAVLRGRLVRYLMRSREITVGRTTHDHSVDIDLSLEGPAWKVSRRQGTIRLRNNGDFFISSEGKRAIYVDGRPILAGNKFRLNNNSVIEVSQGRRGREKLVVQRLSGQPNACPRKQSSSPKPPSKSVLKVSKPRPRTAKPDLNDLAMRNTTNYHPPIEQANSNKSKRPLSAFASIIPKKPKEDERIACPTCQRKFIKSSAEHHIPWCKQQATLIKPPKPPPRKKYVVPKLRVATKDSPTPSQQAQQKTSADCNPSVVSREQAAGKSRRDESRIRVEKYSKAKSASRESPARASNPLVISKEQATNRSRRVRSPTAGDRNVKANSTSREPPTGNSQPSRKCQLSAIETMAADPGGRGVQAATKPQTPKRKLYSSYSRSAYLAGTQASGFRATQH